MDTIKSAGKIHFEDVPEIIVSDTDGKYRDPEDMDKVFEIEKNQLKVRCSFHEILLRRFFL